MGLDDAIAADEAARKKAKADADNYRILNRAAVDEACARFADLASVHPRLRPSAVHGNMTGWMVGGALVRPDGTWFAIPVPDATMLEAKMVEMLRE